MELFEASHVPPLCPFQDKEHFSQLYQFIEFFRGLYTDLFSSPDETSLSQIQRYVMELLALNPIQVIAERRNAVKKRRTTKRSLELLADLIPFPQTMNFKAKKAHMDSMLYNDKFEETKNYFLENPPKAGLRPLIHKIN